MLIVVPLIVSGFALLMAVLALPGMARLRLTSCLFALGCGQIYIAVAAFGLFLLIENRFRLPPLGNQRALIGSGLLIVGICVTTALSVETTRTYVELAQLVLYIILGVLTLGYLKTGEDLLRFLRACVIAATGVALIALFLVLTGIKSPSDIFLARGSNEGAVFLSLTGVVAAAALFVRSRNPANVIVAILMVYMQYLATSRGSSAVSIATLLAAGFFVFRNPLVRTFLVVVGLYIVVSSLPYFSAAFQGEMNFSARERLALFNHGLWLWQQSPWIGWGWGSTTELAMQTPTTRLYYPHFHNTYVQLMVESGVIGIAIIGTFFYFMISRLLSAIVKIQQPGITMIVVGSLISITISGFFDALTYGADRSVQVIILLALTARAVRLGLEAGRVVAIQPTTVASRNVFHV